MIVLDLYLNGFRNLNNFDVNFIDSKNLIYGNNGVGKTSVLEALFMLGFRKSFLNVRIKDTLNYDKGEYIIKASIESKKKGLFELKGIYTDNKLNIYLSNKKKTIVDINEYYYPLFFSSSNYTQYIESTFLIRKLIDRFIFGVNKIYYNNLVNYNKALKNKNYLLKFKSTDIEISSWNKVLADLSFEIMRKRIFFINEINEILKLKNKNLKIVYEPSINNLENLNKENIYLEYEKLKNKEINIRKNLKGIHLDKYYLIKKNKNLKFFSSGEKKIGLIYIYIAYIELFFKLRKEYPIFFTDDFDTAIDKNNIGIVLNNYPDIQVIATSVNKNNFFNNYINIVE